MSEIFKYIFEMITETIFISNNYFVNFIVLGIVGYLSYKVAFNIVGKLGFRNNLGSFFHWSIRLIVFSLICGAIFTLMKIYTFWISISLIYRIMIIAVCSITIILLIVKRYQNSEMIY